MCRKLAFQGILPHESTGFEQPQSRGKFCKPRSAVGTMCSRASFCLRQPLRDGIWGSSKELACTPFRGNASRSECTQLDSLDTCRQSPQTRIPFPNAKRAPPIRPSTRIPSASLLLCSASLPSWARSLGCSWSRPPRACRGDFARAERKTGRPHQACPGPSDTSPECEGAAGMGKNE